MRWSYKTVLYELKKEGLLGSAFLDESEMEQSLNEYGKAGWELISMLETLDGLIAVFKQPLSLDSGPLYPLETVAEHTRQKRTTEGDDVPLPSGEASALRGRVAMELPEELVLVDDYEVVEDTRDSVDSAEVKVAKSPVDVGTIRIE